MTMNSARTLFILLMPGRRSAPRRWSFQKLCCKRGVRKIVRRVAAMPSKMEVSPFIFPSLDGSTIWILHQGFPKRMAPATLAIYESGGRCHDYQVDAIYTLT